MFLILWYDEHTMGEGDVSGVRAAAAQFGDRLSRIIINAVPELRMHYVETQLIPAVANILPSHPVGESQGGGGLSAIALKQDRM